MVYRKEILETNRDGDIVLNEIRLSGFTITNIAKSLGVNRKTVYDKLSPLQVLKHDAMRIGNLIGVDLLKKYPNNFKKEKKPISKQGPMKRDDVIEILMDKVDKLQDSINFLIDRNNEQDIVFIDSTEASKLLGITAYSLRRHVSNGRIPHYRIAATGALRFLRSELIEMITSGKSSPE